MLKVSFKDNFKKVETFNGKATVVTLTGKTLCPDFMIDCLPNKVWKWIKYHPSVDVSKGFTGNEMYYILKVSGKSVCAEGDTFDAKTGERIAECRAKIKLYKFMHTLAVMLGYHYYNIIYGNTYIDIEDNIKEGLYHVYTRYSELLQHEKRHLYELLQKTV